MQKQEPPTTIDADFARFHELSPETLAILLDLLPRVSDSSIQQSIHPPLGHPRSPAVQNCYKLRFEAAEQRYARMKGVVTASLEEQLRLTSENKCLRAARLVVRNGMELDCGATLNTLLSDKGVGMAVARYSSVAQEVYSLSSRLDAALDENHKLSALNRELRGERAVASDDQVQSVPSGQEEALMIEIQVQREKIIKLEFECHRLQSNNDRFEYDERLRECEDVFDQILGRERLDHSIEDIPGASLKAFHPIGTCKNLSCAAYARRLRGGLRKSITEAYVRERNVRLNGYIKERIMPLETLRMEKDLVIKSLQQRICRFEQTLRMTSEEADRVELSSVSEKIYESATQLHDLQSQCAAATARLVHVQTMLSKTHTEHDAVLRELGELRKEMEGLSDERTLIDGSRSRLAEERDLTAKYREDMAQFQNGRLGAAFRERKDQLEALQREMDGLRMEKTALEFPSGGGDERVMSDEMEEEGASSFGHKKLKIDAAFDKIADVGVRMVCRCGAWIPLNQVEKHAQEVHSVNSRRVLVCDAGCGYFVLNGSRSEINQHMQSSSCTLRLAQIEKLLSGI